jgi:hypothetical protein
MNTFGYFCDIKIIATLTTVDATKFCSNLKLALKNNDGTSTDINGTDLISEL